jgi:hypothetical protein
MKTHTHICICDHIYTHAHGSTCTDMETTSQLKGKETRNNWQYSWVSKNFTKHTTHRMSPEPLHSLYQPPNRKFHTVFNLCILFKFNLNTFITNKACQHSIFCLSAFKLQSDLCSGANFLLHVIHTIYIKHKALAFQLSALSSKWNKTLPKGITFISRAP